MRHYVILSCPKAFVSGIGPCPPPAQQSDAFPAVGGSPASPRKVTLNHGTGFSERYYKMSVLAYGVVAVSQECGLVELIDDCIPLRDIKHLAADMAAFVS